jgi:hypothetical protein
MATFLTRETLCLSGALLLVVLLAILLYNRLVQARARTLEAWAGIEVQLKRRADLVPNLVSAIKGYSATSGGCLMRSLRPGPQSQQLRARLPQAGPIMPLTPHGGASWH